LGDPTWSKLVPTLVPLLRDRGDVVDEQLGGEGGGEVVGQFGTDPASQKAVDASLAVRLTHIRHAIV
jgi:hypothetical protein